MRSERSFLLGALAGAIAAAINEVVVRLPGYVDTILNRYDVIVIVDAAAIFVPVYILSYRNPGASVLRVAIGTIVATVVIFSVRTLILRHDEIFEHRSWVIIPIIVHSVLAIPNAFAGAYMGRRARLRRMRQSGE